jgi:magnesium-transporting ATPase (P-type)
VLAIAEAEERAITRTHLSDDISSELTLLGLVGFADPPRDEVPKRSRPARAPAFGSR